MGILGKLLGGLGHSRATSSASGDHHKGKPSGESSGGGSSAGTRTGLFHGQSQFCRGKS